MNKVFVSLALTATLACMSAAQEGRVAPALTARDNPQALYSQPNTAQPPVANLSSLPFCPPKTCLYYAGDFDSANSNANGLINANDPGSSIEAWVWVGVKPSKAATVTGVTFNELFSEGFVGTNPTPFQTLINVVQNVGGTVVCNTTGNATLKAYGESDFGLVQYSYTVKKLAQPCRIAKPSKKAPSTYVNLLPTSRNGYGYAINVEDADPPNHRGWKNDLDDCYFNTYGFGGTFVPCITQGPFDEFSIALTGKK